MKIGILTLPFTTNYGGILQAYALSTVLERQGHKVVVFDNHYMPEFSYGKFKLYLMYGYRVLKFFIKGGKTVIFREKRIKEEYGFIVKNLKVFIDNHFHLSYIPYINSIKLNEFDAIIVGSDQIWRKSYILEMWHSSPEDSFLYFAKNDCIKKISYAASFGNDHWNYTEEQTAKIKDVLKKYDGISVRETSALQICKNILKVDARIVLDPTLLLKEEDYDILYESTVVHSNKKHLLCYVLDMDDTKRLFVERVANEKELKIVDVYKRWSDVTKPLETRILQSVESWLYAFKTADFIITDSFHACAFSIIYRKPFIALGNKERGMARFESLLDMFELRDNLLTNTNQYDSTRTYSIEEQTIEILDKKRNDSILFLKELL